MIKIPAAAKQPERYIKGLHIAIVSESDYWMAQQMLDKKKPKKTHLKSEFPLRGILKCWCGKYMTAAWSSDRKEKYVYYFCKYHRSVNVSGIKLYVRFSEILNHLCLPVESVQYLKERTEKEFTKAIEAQSMQLISKNKELNDVDRAIDKLEEKMMKDEIESATYKKWFKKYSIEKAGITNDINRLMGKMAKADYVSSDVDKYSRAI